MSVNRPNMLAWIQELESGNRQQCTGRLTKIDGEGNLSHCCLGVATEMYIEAGIGNITFSEDDGIDVSGNRSRCRVYKYDMEGYQYPLLESSWLPRPVREWLGLAANDAQVTDENGKVWDAAHVNDGEGWDFAAIAAGLRRRYLNEPAEQEVQQLG